MAHGAISASDVGGYRMSPPKGQVARVVQSLRRSPLAIAGLTILAVLVSAGVAAPLVAPYDPLELQVGSALSGPSFAHLLGTDQLGRDIFSRTVFGARASLVLGGGATLVALAIGVPVGLLSGYRGGWVDALLMRSVDVLLAFPFLVLALVMVIVLGPGSQNVILALGIGATPLFSRLVRSSTLSLREREYVMAARAMGASGTRIVVRHILPNALGPIIVSASLLMAVAILIEAALSYLGLGSQPPAASWGADLNNGLAYMQTSSWMVFGPGGAILVTAVGLNLLGDGIRDIIDPRLRL